MVRAVAISAAMVPVMLAAVFSGGLLTVQADAGFIFRACKKTKNPSLCVAVLSADPRSATASTVHGLASFALQIATDTAEHNSEAIEEMAKSSQLGTPEGDALRVCFGAYGEAASDLDIDARPWFDSGDYAGAWKLLSGVKGAGDACENAFKGVSKKSPVTDIDRQMTERCDVACDLVGLLIPK